jgi:hypothetical protein
MCLFALEGYRDWANRLAHPLLRPLARQAFALLSKERSRISRWLALASDLEIAQTLSLVNAPACAPHPPAVPKTLGPMTAEQRPGVEPPTNADNVVQLTLDAQPPGQSGAACDLSNRMKASECRSTESSR